MIVAPGLDMAVSAVIILSAAMTMIWWIVKLTIRSELDGFEVRLTKHMDATYVRRDECSLKHEESGRRIERLEDA